VSLTGPAIEEVKAGNEILKSLGYRSFGVNLISCPTCGRLEADLLSIVQSLQEPLSKIAAPLNIAVMGCVVNGPGESKGADIGVSLGKDHAILYVKGESRGQIPVEKVKDEILAAIREV
jgi:(E)-4-hydroxy-3-methylbut-2-enyl-diphosphate synthase